MSDIILGLFLEVFILLCLLYFEDIKNMLKEVDYTTLLLAIIAMMLIEIIAKF